MTTKSLKVIFDTNVWISFLIGKRLKKLKNHITDGSITIVISKQLIIELKTVTAREKLQKYFPEESVLELITLLETIAVSFEIHSTHFNSRDPKDNFLLDLIDASKADYLITGDKDLLEHNPFQTAKILTPAAFENELKSLNK